MALSILLLFIAFASVLCQETEDHLENDSYVNFVVVGATGSLAQKYLWQGMYDLREEIGERETPEKILLIYGGARAEECKGANALKDILDTNVVYTNEKSMEKFKSTVEYVQLKTCSHYEALCRDTFNVQLTPEKNPQEFCEADGGCSQDRGSDSLNHFLKDRHRREAGRIFYLAVPPYSYAEVAECINRVCRPPNSNSWLRLVLEKPFGTNVDTVNSLVNSLKQDFTEDEIFLVDHYLGKPAVQNILSFRHHNRLWLDPLLNGNHVEKIEIIIKEKEDVEGRLNYYDTYGVFLDILQNHAMEMLSLVAMDLPPSLDDSLAIRRQKLRFLHSLLTIHPDHVVAAQYSDYVAHGKEEFGKSDFDSRIPTFGAVVVQTPTERWRGVPMFLVSGKALDAKVSLARITFRNTSLSFSEPHLTNGLPIPAKNGVISIFVSSEQSKVPWMSISDAISAQHYIVTNWEEYRTEVLEESRKTFRFVGRDRAYSTVVSNVFAGKRDSFVGMEQLTASWIIWDEYLKVSSNVKPKLYQRGSMDDVAIAWTPHGLRFVHNDVLDDVQMEPDIEEYLDLKFCNAKTISVTVKPLNKLAETIVQDLRTEVSSTGDDFHVAIPGGRTPLPIFHRLAHDTHFPWRRIHFWFTDERCVPLSDHRSNFLNAEEHLFKHLQLPHLNIHPMPVDLTSGLCQKKDDGVTLYADQLHRHLGANNSLDLVLLGVGEDGHVASIFPQKDTGSDSLDDDHCDTLIGFNHGGKLVQMTEAADGNVVKQRMSLTFDAIAAAKKVFLVITGKGKHAVLQELISGHRASKYFPVKNVEAMREVRVYVDHDAYYG